MRRLEAGAGSPSAAGAHAGSAAAAPRTRPEARSNAATRPLFVGTKAVIASTAEAKLHGFRPAYQFITFDCHKPA